MDYQLELDWNDFLQRYWQKRPVIIKHAFRDFVDPLSSDELVGLDMGAEVDSRLVSHDDGVWQVSHSPFASYDQPGGPQLVVADTGGGRSLARTLGGAHAALPSLAWLAHRRSNNFVFGSRRRRRPLSQSI